MTGGDAAEAASLRLPDGRRLGFAQYGDPDGQPIILLHGTPGSRLMFSVAESPARRLGLRLICPDRPGIGLSSPHPDRTLASFADDLAALRGQLGLPRTALFGVSGGAPYAVVAAARHPAAVSLLALVSPMGPVADLAGVVPIHPGHRGFFLWFGQTRWLAPGASAIAVRFFLSDPQAFHRRFAKMLGPPDEATLMRPEIARHVERDVRECVRQGVDGAMQDFALYGRSWNCDFSAVRAPVLFWQGTADKIVPPAVSFALAARLPTVSVHRIVGAGHFWIYDNVEPVLTAVRDALTPLTRR